jgi:hypothetical protein
MFEIFVFNRIGFLFFLLFLLELGGFGIVEALLISELEDINVLGLIVAGNSFVFVVGDECDFRTC